MLDTMLWSSISYGEDCHLLLIEKGIISSSLWLKCQLSSMCKLERMRLRHKLTIEICRLWDYLLRYSSIPKSINWIGFMPILARTMIELSYLQFAMKYWELLLLNFLLLNYLLKETKFLKESNHSCQKELLTSISWLTILLSLNSLSARNIWRLFKANKLLNKKQKEQSMKSNRQNKPKNPQLLRLKHRLNLFN